MTSNDVRLRPGNVHSADGLGRCAEVGRGALSRKVSRIYFRADAAFANPEVYEFLEAERSKCAIRFPRTASCKKKDQPSPDHPIGRPPNEVRRSYANFTCQAGSWTKSRRVVAKDDRGIRAELYPRVGFISPTWPARRARRGFLQQTRNMRAGSRKARARSNGRGSRAGRSPRTPFVFSFMPSPTISAISCARWRRGADQGLVADELSRRSSSRSARRSSAMDAMSRSRWPRSPFRESIRRHSAADRGTSTAASHINRVKRSFVTRPSQTHGRGAPQ